MKDIFKVLEELDIKYEQVEHPAVYTCAEADQYDRGWDCGRCKNLLLRNKKGDKNYLVITGADKRMNLGELQAKISESKLSFGSEERLNKYLGLTPGAVSPFGLINDENKEVIVLVDNEILSNSKLGFHPNANTATLIISVDDFKKFLAWTGNEVVYLDV